jgi:hypothetical protein
MKIKPIHSIKVNGLPIYDDEMSEKDLLEKHGLPVQTLLNHNIVEPRAYKKTFGRNRYQTIYKYTDWSVATNEERV